MTATKSINEIANASFVKAVRHVRTDGPVSIFGIADHLAEQAADVDGGNCDAVAAACVRMAVERNIVTVETIDGVDYISVR